LSSWDSPPTDVEMEEIAPLLTRIQALKWGRRGALSGTSTHGVFRTTSSPTPATPSFQALDLFWIGRFFSSMWRSDGEERCWQAGQSSYVTSQDFIKFWGKFFAFALLEMIGISQRFKTFWVYLKDLLEKYFKLSIIFLKNLLWEKPKIKYYFLAFNQPYASLLAKDSCFTKLLYSI
jgi:hypothetical protein